MTKKSLSDLLREEAFSDVPGNTSNTTQGKSPQVLLSSQSTTSRNLSRMTKAQLEVKIKELTETLDKTNQRVSDLQTSLEQEKILVTTLQLDTQKANQYQTELEEQKQLIEKLYMQLQKREEMAVQLAEQQQVIDKLKAQVAQKPIPPQSSSKSQAAMVLKMEKSRPSDLRSFGRHVAPSSSNEELTDENIGWFD